jgi:hypothetical protein
MTKNISNQEKFQIIDGTAAITVGNGTYQLYVSADGINYTSKGDAVTGPDTIILANAPKGLFCFIDGIPTGEEITVLL